MHHLICPHAEPEFLLSHLRAAQQDACASASGATPRLKLSLIEGIFLYN